MNPLATSPGRCGLVTRDAALDLLAEWGVLLPDFGRGMSPPRGWSPPRGCSTCDAMGLDGDCPYCNDDCHGI